MIQKKNKNIQPCNHTATVAERIQKNDTKSHAIHHKSEL